MLRRIGLALVLVVLAVAGWAWWRIGRLDAEQVRPAVWMLSGIGSNVAVLVTDEGVVIVDTMTLVRQGRLIQEAVAAITPKPITTLVNTHYHLDHTHGNPAFRPGTPVIATGRTLRHLRERDADFWREAPARDLLPTVTFDDAHEMRLGDKTLRARHLGRGHTDGDLVVLFVEDRVLVVGDLFFNGHWPNIDLEAGGSVAEWPATIDRVLALDFDTVIPGHGPVSDRAGLKRFRDFMASLWSQTKLYADRGASLAQAQELVKLGEFGLRPLWWFPVLNQRFVVGRAYEEATRRPAS